MKERERERESDCVCVCVCCVVCGVFSTGESRKSFPETCGNEIKRRCQEETADETNA